MGIFSSKKTKSASEAEADFERDIRDALTRARMAKVNEGFIRRTLQVHADSITRAISQAIEIRNRVVPASPPGIFVDGKRAQ
jgi:hypothetical protein